MSGSERPPQRRVSQRARVGPNGRNFMAGRDVRTTEINNYLGPNSGPGRSMGWRRLSLLVAGVLVLSAAVSAFLLWEYHLREADLSAARSRATAPVHSGGPTAPAGGATASASRTAPAPDPGPPFTVRTSFPGSALDPITADSPWDFVLDRPLTPPEIAGLERLDGTNGQAVWDYLRQFGARIASDDWDTGPRTTFKMLFLRDRGTSLSIQNMQPVDISCTESTAVTVVNFVTEGDEAVPTVEFSLLRPNVPLAQTNSAGETTGPYFGDHQIDLGAGTTPGALDIQVTGAPGESCSWRFNVGYATASGSATRLVDNSGKPFVLEAAPLHPVQHLLYGLDNSGHPRWADCSTTPSACD